MTRALYRLIVHLHPPAFRRRFGGEMMCIFDEARGKTAGLLKDGLLSLARRWILRTDYWKIALALLGGFLEVFSFGFPWKNRQYPIRNQLSLTPSNEQVLFFAIALICCLFIVITSLTIWTSGNHRRRSKYRKKRPQNVWSRNVSAGCL